MNKFYIILVLFFFSFSSIGQNCNFEKVLIEVDDFNIKGDFKRSITLLDSLLQCQNLSDKEIIDLHIESYLAQRNRNKTKRAYRAMSKAKHLRDSLNYSPDLDFQLKLMEIYCLRNLGELYDEIFPSLQETIEDENFQDNYYLGRYYFAKRVSDPEDKTLERRKNLKKALEYFKLVEGVEPYYESHIYRELGNKNQGKGDFEKAISYYQQELSVHKKYYGEEYLDVGICHFNIANIHYEKQEFQMAIDNYVITHKIWSREFKKDGRWMLSLNEAMGDMYYELGDRKNSLKHYNQTMLGKSDGSLDPTENAIFSADSLYENGKFDLAVEIYNEAFQRRIELYGKDHVYTGACKNYAAKALDRAGETNLSLESYQDAIDILVTEMDNTNWDQNPTLSMSVSSHKYLIESLMGKGKVLLELYEETSDKKQLEIAFETYDVAVEILKKFRGDMNTEASKLFWTNKTREMFEDCILTSLELFELKNDSVFLEKAFEYSEQNKAMLLSANLWDQQITSFANVPKEILNREIELSSEINNYKGKIESEEKKCDKAREKMLELWKKEIFELENDYTSLLVEIHNKYPEYYDLKFDYNSAQVSDIQENLLQEKSALLSYYVGKKNIFVFTITKEDLSFRQLEDSKGIQELVRRYYSLMKDPERFLNEPQKSFTDFVDYSYELYEALIKVEIESLSESIDQLIISTDGVLSYIPFESFIKTKVENSNSKFRDLDYLIKNYSFAYCQNAKIALSLNASIPTEFKYVGMAPDYKDSDFTTYSLSALEYNVPEVTMASKIFNGINLVNNHASEDYLKNHSRDMGILHLAAHGQLEDQHPLLSKLFLNSSGSEDGMLHIYEIYSMSLPAQLVVLSACNTASGEILEGEGIISLERAFQYSGSKSVLSSLWSVDDNSSKEITLNFFKRIKDGERKDVALRMAKLDYINSTSPEYSNPFYWASFRLSGNTAPVILKTSKWKLVLVILVLTIAVLYLPSRMKRARRKT